MSHKRSAASLESREIRATRIARAIEKRYGDGSGFPDGMPRVGGYESEGQYHWRLRHKNLAKPHLKSQRVVTSATEMQKLMHVVLDIIDTALEEKGLDPIKPRPSRRLP